MDYVATFPFYQRIEENKREVLTYNQSSIQITQDMLTKIDEFLNYHVEYQEYLKQLESVRPGDSQFLSQFRVYS
jgi:hypothetical protein